MWLGRLESAPPGRGLKWPHPKTDTSDVGLKWAPPADAVSFRPGVPVSSTAA